MSRMGYVSIFDGKFVREDSTKCICDCCGQLFFSFRNKYECIQCDTLSIDMKERIIRERENKMRREARRVNRTIVVGRNVE